MLPPPHDAPIPEALPVSDDLRTHLVTGFALFRGLGLAEREEVGRLARGSRLARGGLLFVEGDPASALHLVFEGQLRLSKADHGRDEVLVQLVRPGDGCGWTGSPEHATHTVTARASGPVRALSWDRPDLERLLERHSVLARNALRLLGRRLRERTDLHSSLSEERVPRRLARTILCLARPSGRRFEDGVYEDLPLSRLDLAQLAGTTLFTVSRTLSEWEGQGIVEAGRRRVVVRDHGRLAEFALGATRVPGARRTSLRQRKDRPPESR